MLLHPAALTLQAVVLSCPNKSAAGQICGKSVDAQLFSNHSARPTQKKRVTTIQRHFHKQLLESVTTSPVDRAALLSQSTSHTGAHLMQPSSEAYEAGTKPGDLQQHHCYGCRYGGGVDRRHAAVARCLADVIHPHNGTKVHIEQAIPSPHSCGEWPGRTRTHGSRL